MGPSIILVRPQLGENIGAAARVMGNFGVADLRLVAPRDGWPNPAAQPMSAGALDGRVSVHVFDDTPSALTGLSQIAATTARGRDLPIPVLGVTSAVARLNGAMQSGAGVGVMFGHEASGLSNDDIALADMIVSYPVDSAFPSLNLAQAVGVFCSTWRVWADGRGGDAPVPRAASAQAPASSPPASKDEVVGLQDHMIDALERAGFFFPPEKAVVMQRNLRAMLTRPQFTQQEVQTLRGAIKALENGPRRRARAMLDVKAGDEDDPLVG